MSPNLQTTQAQYGQDYPSRADCIWAPAAERSGLSPQLPLNATELTMQKPSYFDQAAEVLERALRATAIPSKGDFLKKHCA